MCVKQKRTFNFYFSLTILPFTSSVHALTIRDLSIFGEVEFLKSYEDDDDFRLKDVVRIQSTRSVFRLGIFRVAPSRIHDGFLVNGVLSELVSSIKGLSYAFTRNSVIGRWRLWDGRRATRKHEAIFISSEMHSHPVIRLALSPSFLSFHHHGIEYLTNRFESLVVRFEL